MNISGSGKICGGDYNEEVKVSGSGKIEGNLRCSAFKCSGSAKVEGDLICNEELKVSGSMKVEKSTEAKNIHISGAIKSGGKCTAENEIKISGGAAFDSDLKCSLLRCSGGINVEGGIEAEEVIVSGAISCAGLLNAEKIDIELSLKGKGINIGSIGGSEIKIYSDADPKKTVTRLSLFSKLVGPGRSGSLTVEECIEGDVIAIECVKTPKVVGRIIAIGDGCEIDTVQYSENIEIHPKAKVGHCEKV